MKQVDEGIILQNFDSIISERNNNICTILDVLKSDVTSTRFILAIIMRDPINNCL